MVALTEEEHQLDRDGNAGRSRWRALIVTCMGLLMIVLDGTIVNVALPSLGRDLGLSDSSLVWVVSGYILPFGGSLPVCGRLGDYYGHQYVFLLGIVLFALASGACGLAQADGVLIGARSAQGIGAAAILAASVPLILERFTDLSERARVLAMVSAVFASGSSAGLLLGGLVTALLSWRWIFLVNIPIAVGVYVLFPVSRQCAGPERRGGRFDIAGFLAVTLSLTFAVLAVLNATRSGWWSLNAVLPLLAATTLGVVFIAIEYQVEAPVFPFRLLANRNMVVGVLIGAFWAGAQSAWFFFCSLYLQLVLEYDPLWAGLAFLPGCAMTIVFSLGITERLVNRFGMVLPVITGTLICALGLALFARVPTNASFVVDILPAMVFLGIGCGMANGPLILCTLHDVHQDDYGVASGVLNSSMILASAFALAFLGGTASARTGSLVNSGSSLKAALNSGYHLGFGISVLLACMAVLMSFRLFRANKA